MAASLSDGEFHRMQLQLIELRTINYELEGKNKKLERDLLEFQEKHDILDRELGKAKQAINKSKKAKDVEALLHETDSLQRKLQSQEEEFRLQNQTLMAELAMLISSNEEMKKEMESRKEQTTATADGAGKEPDNSDELRRLHAENSALQKKLNALHDKFEREFSGKGEQSTQSTSSPVTSSQQEGVMLDNNKIEVDLNDGSSKTDLSLSATTDLSDMINSLQLQLDTEREEKLMIKVELEQKQKESKEQIASLQEELEKASEKLKKKQESYLQLHAEKEQLFKESNLKLDEGHAARDRDQKYYKDQITKLQMEIEKSKQENEQQQILSEKQAEELRQQLAELKKEVDTSAMVATHQLQEQGSKFLAEIAVLRDSQQKLEKEKDDWLIQLQESRRVGEDAISHMQAAQTERDAQILAVQQISKVAEKRKTLLDELAIKYQKEYDAHRENIRQMEMKHAEEVDKQQSEIDERSRKINELSKQMPLIEELNRKVHSLEDTKGWLERRLLEVEEQLSSMVMANGQERDSLVASHQAEMEEITNSHRQEVERLNKEREMVEENRAQREAELNEELADLKNKANNLKQEIKDTEDEKKLHEKKGITVLKDLKRQLHAERKRAEKLQAKLQEVLSEGSNRTMEDLFRSPDIDVQTGDASSVSSWGASASGLGKDSIASGPQSPVSGSNDLASDASVGDEYNDLLKRIGILQQEKWALEEKVNHLEVSNSCMAEDILNKTSIIEHYVMDSRTGPKQTSPHEDKLTLKKVMDLVNKGSDHAQHTQDMNRKLQSMLEETLTKNMHLQQHLELMSQEVVRLSKFSASAATRTAPDMSFKEVIPPSSLPLSSTTAVPLSSTTAVPLSSTTAIPLLTSAASNNDSQSSSDRESSVASDENFEVISGPAVDEDIVVVDETLS